MLIGTVNRALCDYGKMNPRANEGVGNPGFEKGQSVVALAFHAAALWRRPQGPGVFQPRCFGYDLGDARVKHPLRAPST